MAEKSKRRYFSYYDFDGKEIKRADYQKIIKEKSLKYRWFKMRRESGDEFIRAELMNNFNVPFFRKMRREELLSRETITSIEARWIFYLYFNGKVEKGEKKNIYFFVFSNTVIGSGRVNFDFDDTKALAPDYFCFKSEADAKKAISFLEEEAKKIKRSPEGIIGRCESSEIDGMGLDSREYWDRHNDESKEFIKNTFIKFHHELHESNQIGIFDLNQEISYKPPRTKDNPITVSPLRGRW